MSVPAVTIRPPETPAEQDAFFRLAAATFVRSVPADIAAADWRRFTVEAPQYHPSNARGAFRGAAYLGGYLIDERWLCIGSARLRAGCIGAVVTHPEHRRQGVATALMRDSLAYARGRGHVLLLLHGLADFYSPYGYIDVFDRTEQIIACAHILAQPPSPYQVRAATPDDAPALLDLYRRHYGPYPGSFTRTLAQQEYLLRFACSLERQAYRQRDGLPYAPPVVALGPDGWPRGYLIPGWGPLQAFGSEATADDWPAALALLQHHARLLAALPEPPAEVRWPLPPDAPTFYLLADNLPVRTEIHHHPHAGWMASLIDAPALIESLLPVWQERWSRRPPTQAATLALTVDEATWTLELAPGGVRLLERTPGDARAVRLSARVLTQLVFGYRPASWAALQPDQQVQDDLIPLLDALFPPGQSWIAPSDGC